MSQVQAPPRSTAPIPTADTHPEADTSGIAVGTALVRRLERGFRMGVDVQIAGVCGRQQAGCCRSATWQAKCRVLEVTTDGCASDTRRLLAGKVTRGCAEQMAERGSTLLSVTRCSGSRRGREWEAMPPSVTVNRSHVICNRPRPGATLRVAPTPAAALASDGPACAQPTDRTHPQPRACTRTPAALPGK